MSKVECPMCKHHFEESETFGWGADSNNDPCVEQLSCPKCYVGTEQLFTCEMCPSRNVCELEEACGATLSVSYESFVEVK